MDVPFQALIDRLDRLSAQFDDLRRLIRKAVRLADDDPEMALTRIRKVLEYVVHDAFERLVKEPPGTRPLENLLQRLVKDGHLPLHLAPHATFVRELGNAGTHRGDGHYKMSDVSVALIHLGAILDWYFELVRPDAAFAPASPDPPPAADGPPRPAAQEPDGPSVASTERRRERWTIFVAAAGFGVGLLGVVIFVEMDRDPSRVANDAISKSGISAEVKKPEVASMAPPREITNSIGMKLVLIPAGEFMMGSDETDPDAFDDEVVIDAAGKKAKHRVRITRPFYLGATEVTRGQFRGFVDEAGYQANTEWQKTSFEQTDEHPVVNVSWNDAVAFCEWLSKKEGVRYRLPTEAEWEFACRAGTTTRYSFGDDPKNLARVGNLNGTGTVPVGHYNPNAWGLFDMHGNVREWCSDGYAADYYKRSPVDDPTGAEGAPGRVNRGGGWVFGPRRARSANRFWSSPELRNNLRLGFRLARVQSVR
jgi:formylglycine-generating enzyme